MKTLYAAVLSRLGLSQSEAADLHGVRLDTVKNWSRGRVQVPQGVWDELRAYEKKIAANGVAMLTQWRAVGSPPIELNDAEGCGQPLMAAAHFILHSSGPVTIGETPATRVARQARRPN